MSRWGHPLLKSLQTDKRRFGQNARRWRRLRARRSATLPRLQLTALRPLGLLRNRSRFSNDRARGRRFGNSWPRWGRFSGSGKWNRLFNDTDRRGFFFDVFRLGGWRFGRLDGLGRNNPLRSRASGRLCLDLLKTSLFLEWARADLRLETRRDARGDGPDLAKRTLTPSLQPIVHARKLNCWARCRFPR